MLAVSQACGCDGTTKMFQVDVPTLRPRIEPETCCFQAGRADHLVNAQKPKPYVAGRGGKGL